jgi:hypothetical protein
MHAILLSFANLRNGYIVPFSSFSFITTDLAHTPDLTAPVPYININALSVLVSQSGDTKILHLGDPNFT